MAKKSKAKKTDIVAISDINASRKKIVPCLWFDDEAEEAAYFYITIFPNSRILSITRYGETGPKPSGMVMTISFELDGHKFIALNGGPEFKFTPAISFYVNCENQKEVDRFWSKLSNGGKAEQCGWLRDKYGVSWQIVPNALVRMMTDSDQQKTNQVMKAMLKMSKINIKRLEQAYSK